MDELDNLIGPAAPITSVNVTNNLYDFPELKNAIRELEENIDGVLDACGVISSVNHLVVVPEFNPTVLDPETADLHVIHTSLGANRFIDVKISPKLDITPHRRNCIIINKGPGTIVLIIRNQVDGNEITRDKILKPYRKYDLSIINDGVHRLIY